MNGGRKKEHRLGKTDVFNDKHICPKESFPLAGSPIKHIK